MISKSRLDLGIGGRGRPGKTFLVKGTAAADFAELRETYRFVEDPVNGDTVMFATLDSAVSACRESLGDTVYVAPGHTETYSDATSLNLDKAGIRIIGLGHGSARPTFTFDTATAATVPVTAANIEIENCVFTANFADIVSVFTLTTANNFKLKNCGFKATAVDMNFQYVVDTNAVTSDADGLTIEGCTWIEPDLTTESMVKLDGDNYGITLKDNYLSLGVNNNTASLLAIITAKSAFNVDISGNKVYRLNTDTATGAILVTTDQSDNSGIIADNRVQLADTDAELLVTATSGFGVFENYSSGVAGASGYLLPGADG